MANPLLIIGLDAADAPLVRTWAAEGRLPSLRRLLEDTRRVSIENPPGLYTGAVWPSFFTGVSVGRHGRYYYRQFRSHSYRATRFHAREIAGTPFWETLSRQGKRVAVLDAVFSLPELHQRFDRHRLARVRRSSEASAHAWKGQAAATFRAAAGISWPRFGWTPRRWSMSSP